MTEPDWKRIEELFHGALERPAETRDAWLRAQCADNPGLYREVTALLSADEESDLPARVLSDSARSVEAARQLDSDQRLGPWRILREIGSGGMGSVYLAERADREYRLKVAVKIIRGFPDNQALERLRQERQILASLNHGHIAGLIDGGTTDQGQPYLVMEYIDGIPVDTWCQQQNLSQTWRLRLFREICDAVHHAHQHLIIHRDLKPGNILVTPDGHPKLLDFGIAKLVESGDELDGSDATRLNYATPEYASPEQLEGGTASTASDIYALGMILLALNGHPPGGKAKSTGSRPRAGMRADWRKTLPRDLAAIVEQATREEPSARYPSVAALSADVGRFLDHRPVEAVPDRIGYRIRRFVARHRYGSAAGVMGLILGLGMLAGLITGYDRARKAEARASLEAASANQVSDFMVSLFRAADPRVSGGETIPVTTILEEGRKQLEAGPELEPALLARQLLALGEVHRHMGDLRQAESLLDRALDLYRDLPGQDPARRLRAYTELGMVHILDGDAPAAEAPLAAAMAMVESGDLTDPERIADAHHHWGLVQKDLGHYEDALEHMHTALSLRRDHAGAKDVASTLHNIALTRYDTGRMDAARATLEESLELKRGVMERSHPSYVTSLHVLSMILRNQGHFKASRARVDEVLQAQRKLYGDDHPALQHGHNELAISHHDLGEYEQAIANYKRSLELSLRTADGPSTGVASTLNNLALAHADRGDIEAAEPLLRESLAMRRQMFEPDHPRVDHARFNLARFLLDTGRPDAAGEQLSAVVAHRIERHGGDHPSTLRARLLQAEIDRRGGDTGALQEMTTIVRALRESMPVGTLKRQAMLRRYGRNLTDAGQLDPAREAVGEALDELTTTFGDDHPLAAEARLELARIERLAGRGAHAEAHIEAARPVLVRTHTADSSALLMAGCLARGNADPDCWSATPRLSGKATSAPTHAG